MASSKTGVRAGTFSVDSSTGYAIFQSNRSVIERGLQTGITSPGDGQPARYFRIDNDSASASTIIVNIPDQWGTSTVTIPAGGFKEFFNVDYVTIAATSGTLTGTYYVGLDM